MDARKLLGELHEKEILLILAMRHKYRFGELVVIMRDGIPYRLKRVEEFDDLTKIPQES